MEVNDALINKLAELAKLEFNPAEKSAIKNDLQRMIRFVDKLNELDLSNTEPLLFMTDETNVLRDDEVNGMMSREAGLKNAPDHDHRFFTVPKVIKAPAGPKE